MPEPYTEAWRGRYREHKAEKAASSLRGLSLKNLTDSMAKEKRLSRPCMVTASASEDGTFDKEIYQGIGKGREHYLCRGDTEKKVQ